MSVNEKMTAIADAIRDKTGGTESLTLDAMATEIPKVYDAGKKAEYDAFWDVLQKNGNGANYYYAFAYGRFGNMYNPKYDIVVSESVTSAGQNIFYYCGLTDVKVAIYTNKHSTNGIFAYASKLKRVPKLVVKESTTVLSAFINCEALEELNIEGVIGKNGLDLHWSTLLNKTSIESVINCLSDETDGLTVTLSETAVANAFTDEEWATLEATKTNWTIALV